MKTGIFILIAVIFSAIPLHSQEIITAERYMEMVSERYAGIRDFEANVVVRSGGAEMPGNLSYLAPHFLRIDFSRPVGQVINFNGEMLTVYLPNERAMLTQQINSRRTSGVPNLTLLRRNYTPSFVTGPSPIPLDSGSQEQVVKIRLVRRSAAEGFREIILSVNPTTRLIRRIEGHTIANVHVQLDMTNIRTNQGVPELRFLYDSPGTAFTYHNFLFRDVD